jgi:predicted nucleic acid-binding protein
MITKEQRTDPAETTAIGGLPNQLDKKEFIAVVSSLVRAEVLEADMTEQESYIFNSVMKRRRQVQVKDASSPIMELAHEIRNYYKNAKNTGISILRPPSVPDAIHLATAIYYGCSKFYTLDSNDKKDNCGLLKLTSPIAGKYNLQVMKPILVQGGFNV